MQARMVGYGADDPGFFCAGMVREHVYLLALLDVDAG